MTTTQIKQAIGRELQCRTEPLLIAALVEDYGPGAKDALRQLRRERKVRLIASGLGVEAAASWQDVDAAWLRAGAIEGEGEWYIFAEKA